ncbi:hypothetical protein [Salinigranum salinum]|nr:hypothetical protein [Salinigranum salinum]
MATEHQSARETYRCPECDGVLAFVDGSWGCGDCGYAPRHAAD